MLKTIYRWSELRRKTHAFLPRCQALVWRRKAPRDVPSPLPELAMGPRWV